MINVYFQHRAYMEQEAARKRALISPTLGIVQAEKKAAAEAAAAKAAAVKAAAAKAAAAEAAAASTSASPLTTTLQPPPTTASTLRTTRAGSPLRTPKTPAAVSLLRRPLRLRAARPPEDA